MEKGREIGQKIGDFSGGIGGFSGVGSPLTSILAPTVVGVRRKDSGTLPLSLAGEGWGEGVRRGGLISERDIVVEIPATAATTTA